MHILIRERFGLEDGAQAEDLGQSPADLVVLSFSDSDLGMFAAGWKSAGGTLPSLRLANLRRLSHPASVDIYIEKTLPAARAILVRLLGGVNYWAYGLGELHALAVRENIALAIIPGEYREDTRLDEASTVPVPLLRQLKLLCDQGGESGARAALEHLAAAAGLMQTPATPVAALPEYGFYAPGQGVVAEAALAADGKRALLVFYRSFLAAADVAPMDALFAGLQRDGFAVHAVFVPSLKAPATARWLRDWVAKSRPDVIVNATAFSARSDDGAGSPFDACDAPVLQVALAGSDRATWANADRGLSPADLAMHVVLPEVDGRIFGGVVSFKEADEADADLGFARLTHQPLADRVDALIAKASRLTHLRRTPRAERTLAIVLANYPGRVDQIAHAVGLDAPASTVGVLNALHTAGYAVDDVPVDSAALIDALLTQSLNWPLADYTAQFARLPQAMQNEITAHWGQPADDATLRDGLFHFSGLRCGNALVLLQPERSLYGTRTQDYHDPRRPPCHSYIAFYLWLAQAQRVDAMIHMGAHGTLEWLPGKSVALSAECWPQVLLGATPLIYPFIVNDPGEAAAAKRRLSAVTLGHMTPPLGTARTSKGTSEVERLLDEYSTADGLDPRRRDGLVQEILNAARDAGLDRDARLDDGLDAQEMLMRLDAFVCDVKDTQFLFGLHIFGQAPEALPLGTEEWQMPYANCAASERAALLDALDGRAIAPGPAGSPWRGRLDVMPTGRNLFAVDPRAVPSRSAHEQGGKLADALLTRHLQDHGDYPHSVMVDLWGSATMRTAGEDFAMALALIGVKPVWDNDSARVSGIEIMPLAMLGRRRVDVTLRMSGLFRDVFPGLPALFDLAVAKLALCEEDAEDNPFRAAQSPRVFGPAPGSYGVEMGEALTDLSDESAARAGEAWLAASSWAYGQDGVSTQAAAAIRNRVAGADAFVHTQDLPETDILLSADYAAHLAGFAAAARTFNGGAPALYHADITNPSATKVRGLSDEIARVVRGRATNPDWIAGQMRHGFRGAAEMASTLDQMAAFAHLAQVVRPHHFDLYFDATLGNDAVRTFIEDTNPAAAAAMRQRFADLLAAGHWTTRRNSVGALLASQAAAQ